MSNRLLWLCLLLPAQAGARRPDFAALEIDRTRFVLEFEWNEDPGFVEGQAVEFEVLVYQHYLGSDLLQKCFAQPPGGHDDDPYLADHNLPEGYTDVWNYSWPGNPEDIVEELEEHCGDIPNAAQWAIAILNPNNIDAIANFGVGTLAAEQLEANTRYRIEYPLEIPSGRPECEADAAGWGFVGVRWVVMPDTCDLPFVGDTEYQCPHFLGFDTCEEDNAVGERWFSRICAPTGRFEFQPHESDRPDEGDCIDADGDGWFAEQPVEMFGTHVNDCADRDPGRYPGSAHEACDCDGSADCVGACDVCEPCEGAACAGSPCRGLRDGDYCGDNGPVDYPGHRDDLVRCGGGQIVATMRCADGCIRQPLGTPDTCAAAGALEPGAYMFPFAGGAHRMMDTPDGHSRRTPHRNWDIDCAFGHAVGSLVSGEVVEAVDGFARGEGGYGNRVCVRDARGITVCHNHLQAGTLAVDEGCFVQAGDHLGGCGNSGFVIPLGNGDGTHVDVYAVNDAEGNVELPHPDTWVRPAAIPSSACVALEACGPPDLESPIGGVELDAVETLRWGAPRCGEQAPSTYRVQIHRARAFPPECDAAPRMQAACAIALNETTQDTEYPVNDGQLDGCGQWFWRVRGGTARVGGEWSAVRTFSVRCEGGCSCVDADGDGYYPTACDDGACAPRTDCDDARGAVHPGAAEICGNGRDDDCRGGDRGCPAACNCVDGDGDGYYPTGCNDAECAPRTDCNDENAAINPGQAEICGNERDDDCQGGDLACPAACSCVDDDGDGYYPTGCNDADCAQRTDCNDGNAAINPGQAEICGNGRDDDCRGGDLACRPTHTVDGCTGAHYVRGCVANCEACTEENGFTANNMAGCGGLSCFAPYGGAGIGGMVVMYTRRAISAFARWSFPPLTGNYRIYADIPAVGGLAAPVGCPAFNLSRDVFYNLKRGDETLRMSDRVDQSFDSGRGRKLIFEGDLTGADGVTVGNAWDGAGGGCGHVLLDRLTIEPY